MLVYIHGGYWRSLDKSDFSWLADSYVAAGISVAVVNYTLCPAARMGDIVRQCERAIAWLYTYHRDDGAHRLVVSGHSAGGHLTAMMFLTDWQRFGMPENMVKAGVAISGIFDLEPLLLYSGNADIRLDAAQVAQLSPARFQPRSDAPLALVAGGDESGEFKRQAQLLFDRWAGVCPAGMGAPLHEPGAHHLRVMDRLAEPTSQLYRLARNLCMA
jgi:arylformamidase